jgi:hypothetical protein
MLLSEAMLSRELAALPWKGTMYLQRARLAPGIVLGKILSLHPVVNFQGTEPMSALLAMLVSGTGSVITLRRYYVHSLPRKELT